MDTNRIGLLAGVLAIASLLPGERARAGDAAADHWGVKSAARYLDERAAAWFGFRSADRGQGTEKVSCLSCHTLLPYALARPTLGRLAREAPPAAFNERLLAQVRQRVQHWDQLDSPRFKLFYDFSEDKKTESLGTEAVLNALVLARDDCQRGLSAPSDPTRLAFRKLWLTQCADGPAKGSWNWLNFGLEPWESNEGRFYGAALAAIAVGTAPGYAHRETDADLREGVVRLRHYLRRTLREQSLHNQLYALWASTVLHELLTPDEQKQISDDVLAKQQAGGWTLAALGKRGPKKGIPPDDRPDGYATGLALHVLQLAGYGRDHPGVARGLAWLRANQQSSGAWPSRSVNQLRKPDTHEGRFMSDAATAFAILALDHP